MEFQENVVIVGAGLSGLATALGLYRLGIRSLVLESSPHLRVTGYAFTAWLNAWKALDALGIGNLLRQARPRQHELIVTSAITGEISSSISLFASNKGERDYETRVLERKVLVQTLTNELPKGSIRFSSKVVRIQESGSYKKLIHLADGSTIRTKVLIGCDGIHSVVARWLGLQNPIPLGKTTIRGYVRTSIERKMMQFMGDGIKYGVAPIDDESLYWFLTFIPSTCPDKEIEHNPSKMKEYMLSKIGKGSQKVKDIVEKTRVEEIISSPLMYRYPWEALRANVAKGNVCVAGDAFHPMTPDIGQGACSSLEDGVVLARCLGRALRCMGKGARDDEEEYEHIKAGLKEYATERKWRAFELMAAAYTVGFIEQGEYKVLQFARDKVFPSLLNNVTPFMSRYDCGRLE